MKKLLWIAFFFILIFFKNIGGVYAIDPSDCTISVDPPSGPPNTTFTISATCTPAETRNFRVSVIDDSGAAVSVERFLDSNPDGTFQTQIEVPALPGQYVVQVVDMTPGVFLEAGYSSLTITDTGEVPQLNCGAEVPTPDGISPDLCPQDCPRMRTGFDEDAREIWTCSGSDFQPRLFCDLFNRPASEGNNINTAIGCIPLITPNEMYTFFVSWGVRFAGGVAFLVIIIASFLIITSRGDRERLKAGKDLLTAAISGLLLVIFSLFILRIIGFSLLKIFQ